MFKIEAKGLAEQLGTLTDIVERQLPFATALALTTTAKMVEAELQSEMRTVFDRPTPYTLNSLRVFPATKEKLVARVWMKDESDKAAPATRWLTPQVYGGQRQDKRSEKLLRARGILPDGKYIVPGRDAKLDQFGNIGRGQLQKIISGLGAQFDRYANSTDSKRSIGNRRRYFVLRNSAGPIGIAERTGRGRDKVKLLLAFAGRPGYRKDFDFFGVGDRVAEEQLDVQFRLALGRALTTRRR
ncbi:hypothetical protein NA655_08530 [Pseudomonas kuykendallii]|uniref:Uncharacterized protein n=1 Tax=Pseudomonas kuykendallii TaxID=1007099 RepID=A0A1H3EJX6_9PSED|nr:hypothetical protein [Pseudomonas kuykendallii]MCQ4271065.1 hypothetical protein [Pseudomonas kuykendallii]SDX79083.1 hypothetical protein SAMN05216287_3757 [Pseudomonas kuykendallii]